MTIHNRLAVTLLLLVIMGMSESSDDIKINPIKSSLLPYNLGKARIINSKHTFIHYVNTGWGL